jgi:hypothetical protein
MDLLHAPRFADQAPAEIYASLLDEGVHHCSIRTMYRILGQNGEVRERREQLRHPTYRKPELLASRHSSTSRSSPSALAASSTPEASAATSSIGTIATIKMPVSV